MPGTRIRTKSNVITSYRLAIHGMRRRLGNKTLVLNGKPMTSKAIVGMLQRQIDELEDTTAAHTAWLRAVAKARATTKTTTAPLLAALRLYLAATFGADSDELLAFGFRPRRAGKQSTRHRLAVTAAVIAALAPPNVSV
jgi:hypothetical protein